MTRLSKKVYFVSAVSIVLLSAAYAPKAEATTTATFVANTCASWVNPAACTGAGAGPGFANATVDVFVDPAVTDWIAWHDQTLPTDVGGQDFVGSYTWIAVDDYLNLTVTNPSGASLTVQMDYNDAFGTSTGPQAVIFGTAADAPNVERWNLSQVHKTFDEPGAFNGLFTSAGNYTFSFSFYNIWTRNYGMPDVYLLVNTADQEIPEPATWFLFGSGLAALRVVRKRLSK